MNSGQNHSEQTRWQTHDRRMPAPGRTSKGEARLRLTSVLTAATVWAFTALATALNVSVVDRSGAPVAGGFRWLLEEDTTVLTVPGVPVNDSIGLVIHKSHAPVAASGSSTTGAATIAVPHPGLRYYLSVLADGYSLGGASIAAGQGAATVTLNKHRIPTAQIAVVAFVDHDRINNALDETDPPLGGCVFIISDALGQLMFDAFGNPLGTRYQKDTAGNYMEDANGDPIVEQMGTGAIRTLTQREFDEGKNPDNLQVGEALIKNIPPGKYGVTAIPPGFDDAGNPVTWVQTTTIEGTPTIDAWVAADEPTYFVEGFGTGFKHVVQGFVKVSPSGPSVIHGQTIRALPWNENWPTGGTASIEGTLRLNHFGKPPTNQGHFAGPPVPEGWIGLNDSAAIPEVTPGGLFAMPCDANGHFVINNLPPGQYQLVSWDKPLLNLFGVHAVMPANGATFRVGPGEHVNLGDILVFRWFGSMEGSVFYDENENGFREAGEAGISQQAVNLRFRNGCMYQSTLSLDDGSYELSAVFPFFKWLVAEVDYARYKPTGMTAVVDAGGVIPPDAGWGMPSDGVRNPQGQYQTDLVTGVANLAAPIINPNTGNNLSRTEVGPVLLEAQHLFLNQNNRIDWGKVEYLPGENGGISGIAFYSTTRAEEDPRNAVGDPWEPGIPRVQFVLYADTDADRVIDDRDGDGGVTLADVDNHPLGWAVGDAKGPEDVDHNSNGTFDEGDALQVAWSDSWDDVTAANPTLGAVQTDPPVVHGKPIIGCDNFSTWNQVRPQVFDGGYFFGDLVPGMYVVQTCPPPGYLIQTEESVNVGFGDAFKPSRLALPPECVGTVENHGGTAGNAYVSDFVPATRTHPYTVASALSLFPAAGEPAPFAGDVRPLADMKWVQVTDGRNAAADFHLYTEVPKAARLCGFVLNDLGAEFNQTGPNFGEKLAAPWIPIAIRDWTGKEISRVYADEFGCYNAMVPSTYNMNLPQPTGVSESMITIVLNDPLLPDGTLDPYYNPMYVTAPWTFNYSPGGTSYLDTPIVPQAAFTTAEVRIDTEPQDHEPVIRRVDGPEAGGGPWISTRRTSTSQRRVTLWSMGMTPVINPDYDPTVAGSQMNVLRDFGFGGTRGSVTLSGVALSIVSWAADRIVVTIPREVPSGDLLVIRGDNGLSTQVGITLHALDPNVTRVHRVPATFPTIQAAIDSLLCRAGDVVLVAPGVYNENVILNKPVHLQGYGAGSTIIYGNPTPVQRLQEWHDRINALGGAELATFLIKDPFLANEAPVVLVCGELQFTEGTVQAPLQGTAVFNAGNPFTKTGQAQVDGFSMLGSKAGGGIFVVCGARYTTLSNNNIHGNQGGDAGGITVGTQDVGFDSMNGDVTIRRNRLHRNSGIAGAGGISVNESSDNYLVEDNVITGNFTRGNGAGIVHWGYCGGTNLIRRNRIVFNENMYAALLFQAGDGGGIYIAGDVAGGTGAGNVIVDGNLIQGNMTGSGKGAGICVTGFNGQDVVANPLNSGAWYELQIVNNIIVNNIAAYAGGGISIEDAVRATIAHNTIANNDCTATSRLLSDPGAASPPQVAGVAVFRHSATLAAALGRDFTSPVIQNNIIWHNRSFYYDPALAGNTGDLAPNPDAPFWDLAVLGTTGTLDVTYCLLTSTAGYGGSNIAGDPQFVQPYTNTIDTAVVLDEGGNNVNLRFLPLNTTGNYHIQPGSSAVDQVPPASLPSLSPLRSDFDGQWRPNGPAADVGADEANGGTSLIARNDFYSVNKNGRLTVSGRGVFDNDSPSSGVNAVLTGAPAHGTLSLATNGRVVYTPAAGYTGVDTFRYRAYVGSAYSLEATVTITVRSANDRPRAVADTFTVNGNGPFTVPAPGVLGNDTDADGDPLTASRISGPTPNVGTLALRADGGFTFTPRTGFQGTVTFRYRASDGSLSSAPSTGALVRLTVTAPRPDFVVTNIAVSPQPVLAGAPMTVQVELRNQGTATGNAGRLTVWRNLGGADVATGTPGDAFVDVGVVAAGATVTVPFALVAPLLPLPIENQPPPLTFRAFANSTAPVQTEFTQANNQVTQAYTVVGYGPAEQNMPMDHDGIDTDGDGDPNNDVAYLHLAAGDGFAKMADGNELYTFGFSDHTEMAMMMTAAHPQEVREMVMMDAMLRAEASSPTIAVREGQRLYIDLTNAGMLMRPDLFDPHSLHFHGFAQAAPIYDGEPMGSLSVNMGATYRYYYKIVDPGTYLYHCHVEATEHMEMGMLGNLYVMPRQNNVPDGTVLGSVVHHTGNRYAYNDGDGSTRYDVDAPLQLGGFDRRFHEEHIAVQPLPFWSLDESYPLINGRGYPDTVNPAPIYNASADNLSQKVTSLVTAKAGQRILLRVSNLSVSDFHTLTVLGIPMRVVGKDARLLRGPTGQDLAYETSSITLGGGESADVILDTAGLTPGTYFVYDARLNHLCNDTEDFGGMMTEIVITP